MTGPVAALVTGPVAALVTVPVLLPVPVALTLINLPLSPVTRVYVFDIAPPMSVYVAHRRCQILATDTLLLHLPASMHRPSIVALLEVYRLSHLSQ